MEFLLGVITTTLVLVLLGIFAVNKKNKREPFFLIRYSQSHIHKILAPILPQVDQIIKSSPKNNQSTKYLKNVNIKVLIVDGKAYWTKNNVFYVSDIIDGQVDKANARVVDTMGMSKVELDKMLFIIDQLRKGE